MVGIQRPFALFLWCMVVTKIPKVNSLQALISSIHKRHLRLDASKLKGTSPDKILSDFDNSRKSHSCKFCEGEFASRNALFRHLRTNVECFNAAAAASGDEQAVLPISLELPKQKFAIRFGYHVDTTAKAGIALFKSKNQNEVAADLIKKCFFESLNVKQPAEPFGSDSITQTSVARHRHPSLAQDHDCSASSDFICINFKGEAVQNATELCIDMQLRIDQHLQSLASQGENNHLTAIHVLNATALPTASNFQAEQSCTQRIYHCLLPLDWLEGGEEGRGWLLEQRLQKPSWTKREHQKRGAIKPPIVLARLKKALKSFESSTVSEDEQDSKLSSPGRFGSLWIRERRCWHNFAAPLLSGKASPSNDPVWRTIDKARLVGIASHGNHCAAVIEIRGDGFVQEQVRRILGSVVSIVNGWLPDDFATAATRSDVCIETPLTPAGRMYFAGGRFHFVELVQGNSFLKESSASSRKWQSQLQSDMLRLAGTESNRQKEERWLDELRDSVAPRLQNQLERIMKEDETRLQRTKSMHVETQPRDTKHNLVVSDESTVPTPYQKTVSLLRDIVAREKWPRTSRARSRVIRSTDNGSADAIPLRGGPNPSAFDGELYQYGSFTVVNTGIVNERRTLGNTLFPDLVRAIFDLEAELAQLDPQTARGTQRSDGVRPPSTHCAVNRNAEFVPHVDSGKGQGQSISMIVGLGDFDGGAICVEGLSYDIRYQPLEFDGWKQRHWTEPFRGERYSLVFFTPAGAGEKGADEMSSGEEKKVEILVSNHQRLLPAFPLLKHRRKSTDALVINEILDAEKGCAYELKNHAREGATDFVGISLKGHKCVLDIGAHIGVFSRYALSVGCQKIIAYEPEPGNLDLLRYNLRPSEDIGASGHNIVIHDAAVAHGSPGSRLLVHARNSNDGTLNTWRHSLEEYSQYVDKTTALPSLMQEGTLTRSKVKTVPFFGGALVPGVSFVKLDCEGAEIDILLSEEAAMDDSWLDVTNLVFEWSFTKEKRVAVFQKAVANLKQAGFEACYEGQGAWWEQHEMWPFHNDLIVYATRP